MAGYGVYLAACGYSHHGPAGRLGFAPKVSPENFAAAFTAAGGWGLYRQHRDGHRQTSDVEVRHGEVTVRTFTLELAAPPDPAHLKVTAHGPRGGVSVASVRTEGATVELTFKTAVKVGAGDHLRVDATVTDH
jgi:hypothetical protein